MKSQQYGIAAFLIMAVTLGGCAGLAQFPSTSMDYIGDLGKLDPDYRTALDEIEQAAGNLEQQKRVRNREIDKRLRVIDQNFGKFREGLSQENVTADFVVAVLEIGVGGAGALVGETVSQILSAASGGLAGARQAYSKAALFDRTLAALLAQMIASRKAVLVRIYEGRAKGIDDYPLSTAVQDLDAYEFAGSLPGAVVATSADATVKNTEAQNHLNQLTTFSFLKDTAGDKLQKFWMPDGKSPDPNNTKLLEEEIAKHGLATGPGRIANFITGAPFADLRVKVAQDLRL